jgi:hypothetical protein
MRKMATGLIGEQYDLRMQSARKMLQTRIDFFAFWRIGVITKQAASSNSTN